MLTVSTMSRARGFAVLALFPMFALTACGSSKTSPAPAATNGPAAVNFWTTAPVSTSYPANAQSATLVTGGTTYTVDTNPGPVSIVTSSTAGASFGASFSAPSTAGVVALTPSAGTSTVAGLSSTISSGTTAAGATVTVDSFGGGTSGYNTSLSYSDYGIWNITTSAGSTTNIGSFVVGSLTPATGVPKTGTAVYAGSVVGLVSVGGVLYTLSGPVALNANFLNNTVSGGTSTTSLYSTATSSPALVGTMNNINFTGGIITGAGFAGTATPALTQGTGASISGTSGTFSGNFYGTAAQEAAGTFQLSGNGSTVVGSFGTRK